MPIVRAYYNPDQFNEIENLSYVCNQLVPGVLCTESGRLTPGSIEFFAIPKDEHDSMHCDVLIDVEAYHYDDRASNVEERALRLQRALSGLFANNTFAVWIKLVTAGWASDVHDPEFDGDTSFKAALDRSIFWLHEMRAMF